jgi:hypothetical protein
VILAGNACKPPATVEAIHDPFAQEADLHTKSAKSLAEFAVKED